MAHRCEFPPIALLAQYNAYGAVAAQPECGLLLSRAQRQKQQRSGAVHSAAIKGVSSSGVNACRDSPEAMASPGSSPKTSMCARRGSVRTLTSLKALHVQHQVL